MRICLLIFLLCGYFVSAQSGATTSLSVQLNNIQSIKVNDSQSAVTIALNNAYEYLNGKSSMLSNHLEIMSSCNYEIKVSASSHLTGTTETIDVGNITVTPSLGTIGGVPQGNISLQSPVLSLSEGTLLTSTTGDIHRSFNVEYKVAGGPDFLNKPADTYTTTVMYTIMQP